MSAPPSGRWVPANDWHQLDGQFAAVPPRVSVIVLHHEQPAALARTLAALSRQSYPAECLEIIVTDDGSATAPTLAPGVRLVRGGAGAQRSRARNRGAYAAHGEVLCFLDADTTPEPDYVAALTRLVALAPEAVCVGRRRHADLSAAAPDTPVELAGPAHALGDPVWLTDAYRASDDLARANARSYRFIISAVLATSAWFFAEIGGFDESFDAYGGEDWEWAHRAWSAGAIFAHEPAAVAWHDGPDWAARDPGDAPAAHRTKNAEAIRLASLIPVAGQRPRGLLGGRPAAVIRLDAEIHPDAAWLTIDGLLAALPSARVLIPAAWLPSFGGDPRVHADGADSAETATRPSAPLQLAVAAPLRVDATALGQLAAALLDEDVGVCELADRHGVLMTLESSRQRARTARWGAVAALPRRRLSPDWLLRLGDVPDVEAHLGGWPGRW